MWIYQGLIIPQTLQRSVSFSPININYNILFFLSAKLLKQKVFSFRMSTKGCLLPQLTWKFAQTNRALGFASCLKFSFRVVKYSYRTRMYLNNYLNVTIINCQKNPFYLRHLQLFLICPDQGSDETGANSFIALYCPLNQHKVVYTTDNAG